MGLSQYSTQIIFSILGIVVIGAGVYAVWSQTTLTAFSNQLLLQLRKAKSDYKLPSFFSGFASILAVAATTAIALFNILSALFFLFITIGINGAGLKILSRFINLILVRAKVPLIYEGSLVLSPAFVGLVTEEEIEKYFGES